MARAGCASTLRLMANTAPPRTSGGLRAIVAGGGVAGLEALLALRALAGELVDLELLAPEPDFWYRALAVAEPFDAARVPRIELATIAEAVSAGFTLGRLASVDPHARIARTEHGKELEYDALVIAAGTVPRPWLDNALTFRGPADADAMRQLLREAEGGAVNSIVFAAPASGVWPLPLYELALQTAVWLRAHAPHVRLDLVTPEPEPLGIFGHAGSAAVRELLRDRGVRVHTGAYAVRYEDGQLELAPPGMLDADRVVTLPRLEGVRILGLPQDDEGFVEVGPDGGVAGLPGVFAAGDITRFPVRHGGIAAQQADVVAESIAAHAGAQVKRHRFHPVLRGIVLTGDGPRHLRSDLTRGSGDAGWAASEPLWWPPAKVAGRHLAPFLAERVGLELRPPRDAGIEVEIELPASG